MATPTMDRVSGGSGDNAPKRGRPRGSVTVTTTRGTGGRFTGPTTTGGTGDTGDGNTTTQREPASDGGRYEQSPIPGATILESASASDNPDRVVRRRRGRPRKEDAEPEVPQFPTEHVAAELATQSINLVQMIAIAFSGPAGAMNDVEYSLATKGLTTTLQKTPLALIEKMMRLFAPGVLGAGVVLWLIRMSQVRKVRPIERAASQITDTHTPATVAPPDTVVSHNGAGDRDGLAVPIPDAIRSGMLGDI